jgi:hypothetical protein
VPITQATASGATNSLNIFSGGNVTTGSSIQIGDLIGTIGVGIIGYTFVVLFFVIGNLGSIRSFFKAKDQQVSLARGFNITRHIFSVLAWFVSGLLAFTFSSVILEKMYNVQMASRLKFFWEARYSSLESSLVTKATNLEVAQWLLAGLDILSKAAYWGIVIIFIIMIIMIFGYVIALFTHFKAESRDMEHFIKGAGSGIIVFVFNVIAISVYISFINNMLLSQRPDIPDIGTVSNVLDIFKTSLAYIVRAGLSGSL